MSETVSIEALLNSPAYAAASAAYDRIADAHGHSYSPESFAEECAGIFSCKCGRTFKTANGRGLHEAATRREAGRRFDAELKVRRGA